MPEEVRAFFTQIVDAWFETPTEKERKKIKQRLAERMGRMSKEAQTKGLTEDKVIEETHIRRVLARSKSLQDAAAVLGIDQATLWRKRKDYGI